MKIKPRDAVQWFATKMETQLKENDYKSGWDDCDGTYLSLRLDQERDELAVFLEKVQHDLVGVSEASLRKDIITECADIANFAMMIAHNVSFVGD